ncbi:MAG: peptidoglycan DD-metalloendopeptidase family protein [Gammaproteobacteria bacterium]
MKIILLSSLCSKAGSLELCLPRVAALATVLMLVTGGGLYWLGYQQALDTQPDINGELREMLVTERRDIERTRHETRAHLDALALRVAELQAQLMRVNALGERLVEVGKLDGDEFDFLSQPPVGGGDSAGEGRSQEVAEIQVDMDRLNDLLLDRERKLLLMEDILMSRQVLSEVLPSGKPVAKGWISSLYGRRTDPFSGKKSTHHGIDFAGKRGAEVIAVASGVVTRAGKTDGYGNLVELRHADGYTTRYAHNQKNLVKVGEVVTKGQTIALLGSTGRANGPHVHFEVRKNGRSVNPKQFVSKK